MAKFPNQRAKKPQEISYEHVKIEPGKWWRGWLSGPVVTIHCHYDGKATRACRAEMTSGELACPWCANKVQPILKWYCPLWSEAGLRSVALAADRYREYTERLIVGEPVLVTKTLTKGCAIRVERSTWTKLAPPIPEADRGPQDLTPWLLRVWEDAELREWCERQCVVTPATPTSTSTSEKRADAEKLPANNLRRLVIDAALQQHGHAPLAAPTTGSTPPTAGETMEELVNRLPHLARARNGKHKSKKGDT